jgi:hypothetical protein
VDPVHHIARAIVKYLVRVYTGCDRKEARVIWITAFLSALAAGMSATLATQETNYGDWLTTTVGLSVFWAISALIWGMREGRR